MELASKAEQAKFSKPTPHQNASRRRASPKKATATEPQIDLSQLPGPSSESQQLDDDTQLIMILNQVTGELMEITAPKGMEVKDVIESLNFQSMEEAVQNPADESMEENQIVNSQDKLENSEQEEETAAAIEMIEHQANEVDQAATSVATEDPILEDQHAASVETDGTAPMIIEQQADKDGEGHITQIMEDDGQGGHEIVLPANCFNDDGSLTLDADTLSRLNLTLSVDENGQQVVTSDSTTFVIETAANE